MRNRWWVAKSRINVLEDNLPVLCLRIRQNPELCWALNILIGTMAALPPARSFLMELFRTTNIIKFNVFSDNYRELMQPWRAVCVLLQWQQQRTLTNVLQTNSDMAHERHESSHGQADVDPPLRRHIPGRSIPLLRPWQSWMVPTISMWDHVDLR